MAYSYSVPFDMQNEGVRHDENGLMEEEDETMQQIFVEAKDAAY